MPGGVGGREPQGLPLSRLLTGVGGTIRLHDLDVIQDNEGAKRDFS
jgi:hypothetical protein